MFFLRPFLLLFSLSLLPSVLSQNEAYDVPMLDRTPNAHRYNTIPPDCSSANIWICNSRQLHDVSACSKRDSCERLNVIIRADPTALVVWKDLRDHVGLVDLLNEDG